jgi:Ca2+/Na+ antiporter
MKKWIIMVAILICCGLYVALKFSLSRGQNANNQVEEAQIEGPDEVNNTDNSHLADSSTSSVSKSEAEAASVVFEEFAGSLKNGRYEQAWKLTSKAFQTRTFAGFEQFKAAMSDEGAIIATYSVHPGSVTREGEFLRLLVRSKESPVDLYGYFTKEDGQWKLNHAQETRDVDRSIE